MLEYFEHVAQPWGTAADDDLMLDERLDEAEHGFIAVQREHATAHAAPPGPPGPRPPSIRHISV